MQYRQLSNKKFEQFFDHQFKDEELETVGELSKVWSQLVLKCLYSARIVRLDISWSVNKLARAVTKWTRASDKLSARLISYIRHTSDCRQYCHVGHTAQHCRLGLFQDPDFAQGVSCIFGSRTFVTISWICKKQAWEALKIQNQPRGESVTNRSEMLVFITNLQTRHFTVCELPSKSIHWMEKSLWQTLGQITLPQNTYAELIPAKKNCNCIIK